MMIWILKGCILLGMWLKTDSKTVNTPTHVQLNEAYTDVKNAIMLPLSRVTKADGGTAVR